MTDTTPAPPATNTAVADLLTPRQRSIAYLASVMLAAAYATTEANADLPWPVIAVYAAWNAAIGVLAVSNTRR